MIKPLYKCIIAWDFDKTIAHTDYPQIFHLHENAKEVLNRLYDDYFYHIISTCRTGPFQNDARDFLKHNNVNFHLINENHPYLINRFKYDSRKISADIYIDDKDINSKLDPNFPDFLTLESKIHQIVNAPGFNTILNS